MKFKKIFIVGFGNIGFRHFQSLNELECFEFYLYDLHYSENFRKAESELAANNKIVLVSDLDEVKNFYFELVIHAGTAVSRYSSLYQLLAVQKIDFFAMIIEKIPFTSKEEWMNFSDLSKKHNINNVFINYPRGQYDSYWVLKSILQKFLHTKSKIDVVVEGGNWNMLSNSLHYIHLVDYLFKFSIPKFNISHLDIFSSRHKECVDAHGTFLITDQLINCKIISNYSETFFTPVIKIFIYDYNQIGVVVNESDGYFTVAEGTATNTYEMKTEYQSALTKKVYSAILMNSCRLPTFLSSMNIDCQYVDKLYSDHIPKGLFVT